MLKLRNTKTMSFLPTESKKSFMSKVLRIIGWIAGAAIGNYSGINMLIPLFVTGVVWLIGTKLLKDERKKIVPVLSVNAGHFLWLALALFLMGTDALSSFGGDIFFYVIGLTWLLKRPSLGALYFLGAFQLVSLGINGYAFVEAAIGSVAHKALLVHVIWRALSLFFIFKLFLLFRNSKNDAAVTH